MLLLTGCRREEIAGLRWDEIDLDTGVLHLPGVRTKNGRITKDAIAEVLKALAQNVSEKYGEGSTFWHSKEGEAGKYAGAKGFRLLAEILKENMPELKKMQLV